MRYKTTVIHLLQQNFCVKFSLNTGTGIDNSVFQKVHLILVSAFLALKCNDNGAYIYSLKIIIYQL
jgi:hypothetical protein